MKFVCNGLTLSEAVMKVSKACAVRTTAPIMEYIKISANRDGVSLLATDGELSILKEIKAEIFEEGAVCVPGKLFADFVSKLTGEEINIATSQNGIVIGYADAGTNMQTLDESEFPVIDFSIDETSFVLKKGDLKKIISETAFCCAQDDSRPILKGCLMNFTDKLEVVALDGYRLALSTAEVLSKSGENKIVCPARTLLEISRLLSDDDEKEITIYTKGGMFMVSCEETVIVSRLYNGEFIDKNKVIPASFSATVTLKKNDLIASVERAAILIRGDKNNLITLNVGSDSVKVASSSEIGNVSESVKAETSGMEFSISMNAKFLLDALKALEEEEVVLSFNGAISPFIVQNKEEKHNLYLILPVRKVS